MANEWVKVELYGQNNDGCPRRYNCASGTAITKGTLMVLTDPRTAAAHAVGGYNNIIAGVAAAGKSATDHADTIACWTDGIFEAVASLAITIGNPIMASGTANCVTTADVPTVCSGAALIGYALEAASAVETINVRLRL